MSTFGVGIGNQKIRYLSKIPLFQIMIKLHIVQRRSTMTTHRNLISYIFDV